MVCATALVAAAPVVAAGAAAPTAPLLRLRTLAASCAACHGTDGDAVGRRAPLQLAGLSKDYFIDQMRAFRDGTRPATVMQQIAKGYSDEDTMALAEYFATRD